MPTDTNVSNLIINVLDEQQYEQIQNPSRTELYLVPEVVDTIPTEGSTNTITSGGVYDALISTQIDVFVIEISCNSTIENITNSTEFTCNVDSRQIVQAFLDGKKFVYYLKCKTMYNDDVYTQLLPSFDFSTDTDVSNGQAYYIFISLEYPACLNSDYDGYKEFSFKLEGDVNIDNPDSLNILNCWAEHITTTINTTHTEPQTPINRGFGRGLNVNLHKVSSTGSYNDLLDKPVIPTIDLTNFNNTDWDYVFNL